MAIVKTLTSALKVPNREYVKPIAAVVDEKPEYLDAVEFRVEWVEYIIPRWVTAEIGFYGAKGKKLDSRNLSTKLPDKKELKGDELHDYILKSPECQALGV